MTEKKHIVIWGNGIAALTAALRFAEEGITVKIVCETSLLRSIDVLIPHGINAATNYWNDGDSITNHFEESVECAGHLISQSLLYKMCEQAPKIINFLERAGVPFDRTVEKELFFQKTADSDFKRCVPAGPHTAQKILKVLQSQLLRFESKKLITCFEGYEFLRHIENENTHSLVVQNIKNQEITAIPTQTVIFADPGWQHHCLAALFEQGVFLANPEFSGGLWTGETFETNKKGIYAIGDCSFRLKGAKPLQGNYLLGLLFSALECSCNIIQNKKTFVAENNKIEVYLNREQENWQALLDLTGPENSYRLFDEWEQIMIQKVDCPRREDRLLEASQEIKKLKDRFLRVGLNDHKTWMNTESVFVRRLPRLFSLAEARIAGALYRQESRGTHQRKDYPERDDNRFLKTTKVKFNPAGPEIFYENCDDSLYPLKNTKYQKIEVA